ncbi:hypothetical protein MHYP_G00167360 [Metynnis hypsauchen]
MEGEWLSREKQNRKTERYFTRGENMLGGIQTDTEWLCRLTGVMSCVSLRFPCLTESEAAALTSANSMSISLLSDEPQPLGNDMEGVQTPPTVVEVEELEKPVAVVVGLVSLP